MARGRGITLQMGDDAPNLNTWNKPGEPKTLSPPAPIRRPGGHFHLAANFQNNTVSRKLITPASLMATLAPRNENPPIHENNDDEDDEDDDSFRDSDDDDFNNHRSLHARFSQRQPVLESVGGYSDDVASAEEDLSGEDDDNESEEVDNAIKFMEGFDRNKDAPGIVSSLAATSERPQTRDDDRLDMRETVESGDTSPSSDKENVESGRGKEINHSVLLANQPSEQSGIWYKKESATPGPQQRTKCDKKLKQPLSEQGIKKQTPPRTASKVSVNLSQEKVTPGSTRNDGSLLEIDGAVPVESSLGYVHNSESDIKFCGEKSPPRKQKLSPAAPEFVPQSSPMPTKCHPWIGNGIHTMSQSQQPTSGTGLLTQPPIPSSSPTVDMTGDNMPPPKVVNSAIGIHPDRSRSSFPGVVTSSPQVPNQMPGLSYPVAPQAGRYSQNLNRWADPNLPFQGYRSPIHHGLDVSRGGDLSVSGVPMDASSVLTPPRQSPYPTPSPYDRYNANNSPHRTGRQVRQMQDSPEHPISMRDSPTQINAGGIPSPYDYVRHHPSGMRGFRPSSVYNSSGEEMSSSTSEEVLLPKPSVSSAPPGINVDTQGVPSLSEINERKRQTTQLSQKDVRASMKREKESIGAQDSPKNDSRHNTGRTEEGNRGSKSNSKKVDDVKPNSSTNRPLREPMGGLSTAEQENEYEWRKYRLIQKVKKVLKEPSEADAAAHQLKDIMVKAQRSFKIFRTRPKELALVIEEVIIHAVSDRKYIDILHQLSEITDGFDHELEGSLKRVEGQFIQAFIGAHLEKTALDYCRFLSHLYHNLSNAGPGTRNVLEQYLNSLAHKWIMPLNEGGSSQLVEESNIKCLEALLSALGPSFPKWTDILEAVKKQVFDSKSQIKKELCLKVLLHMESMSHGVQQETVMFSEIISKESGLEDVKTFAKTEDSPPLRPTGSDTKATSNINNSHATAIPLNPEVIPEDHSKSQSKEAKDTKDTAVADATPYLSPYNDSTKPIYLSTKLKSPPQTKETQQNVPKGQSLKGSLTPSQGPRDDQSNQGGEVDWWDCEDASSQMVMEALQEEIDKIEDSIHEDIKTSGMVPTPDVSSVGEDATEAPLRAIADPSDTDNEDKRKEYGRGNTCQTGDGNFPRRNIDSTDETLPMTGHEVLPSSRYDPVTRSANTPHQQEIWDDELEIGPGSVPLQSIVKRRIDGTSLRCQREHYASNITQATKTYEACASGNDVIQGAGDDACDPMLGERREGIIQEEDDVVILEETSESEGSDDDDVPLIWGDLTPQGPVMAQRPSENTADSAGIIPTVGLIGQQAEFAQAQWNQPKIVFREEPREESHLSEVEVLARQKLQSRRLFSRQVPWAIPHNANQDTLRQSYEDSEVD